MPIFQQSPPPQFYAQPQPRAAQPVRQASRNERYLPAMPEMLRPIEEQRQPVRVAQEPPKAPAGRDEMKGMLVRGQAPEEAKGAPRGRVPVAKLLMPSPEELGIGGTHAAAASFDWTAARRQLDSLGVTAYRLEKASEGGFAFVCSLPHHGEPARQRSFECRADSEAEAFRLALGQVEEWKATNR